MTVFVGKPVPDFKSRALMPDNKLNMSFNLAEYINGYMALIFFYPMDFAYVDPTELIALNNRLHEFEKRKVKIIAISTDSHLAHLQWRQMPVSKGGIGPVGFPIIADVTRSICKGYGVLANDAMALRACFLVDEEAILRNQMIFDFPVGRNIDEIIRIIDAHQFYEKTGKVCPANWQKGDEGLIADEKSLAEFLKNNAHHL